MVNSKKNIIFQGPGGAKFFQWGGGQLFPGGGVQLLIPYIKTHITCDFPRGGGGSGPPVPPLDPHLAAIYLVSQSAK